VESTRVELQFTAPLTAITAAVVGVILNLALFLGYHVLWSQGFAGRFDWQSALIALAAAEVVVRFKCPGADAARPAPGRLGRFLGEIPAGVPRQRIT